MTNKTKCEVCLTETLYIEKWEMENPWDGEKQLVKLCYSCYMCYSKSIAFNREQK